MGIADVTRPVVQEFIGEVSHLAGQPLRPDNANALRKATETYAARLRTEHGLDFIQAVSLLNNAWQGLTHTRAVRTAGRGPSHRGDRS